MMILNLNTNNDQLSQRGFKLIFFCCFTYSIFYLHSPAPHASFHLCYSFKYFYVFFIGVYLESNTDSLLYYSQHDWGLIYAVILCFKRQGKSVYPYFWQSACLCEVTTCHCLAMTVKIFGQFFRLPVSLSTPADQEVRYTDGDTAPRWRNWSPPTQASM